MSIEYPIGHRNVEPTDQEKLFIQLDCHAYDDAMPHVISDLEKGRSPGALSVARPEVLVGFAKAWQRIATDLSKDRATKATYKTRHFENLAEIAATGNPAAIEALSKFVTSLGEMALVTTLILDNRQAIEAWHLDRAYIQYLGTFDPQHIGHRIAVQSTLETEGNSASAILHVMGQHPRKTSLSASYEDRFKQSEERFYESNLLDNQRITQVDVPGGVGLAEEYPKQMELLALLSGDDEYRWLTGSDKVLLDVSAIKEGYSAEKAITRFSDPKMHAYVVHRQSDDRQALENGIDFVTDHFGTKVTLVEEIPYDCAPASSSRIKQLRTEGRDDEANHMELYELER
jgi:hypothetical protein